MIRRKTFALSKSCGSTSSRLSVIKATTTNRSALPNLLDRNGHAQKVW